MAGDLCAVLRPDIAATPEIIGRDIVGRPFAGVDRSKNVDRGGDLRARCQRALRGSAVRRVVRRLAGHRDVVHMALAQAPMG